ncbi:uncharacterized protein LOC116200404 [Punica granatum]|uniref:DOG1 domain-containing protein n=2 Tax=Punica granatum TaxID=22663 RepID=A0A218WAY1_PUNGR|nr:uncharacterized protein LOC116200404 [Punica granatum]OWM69618.1 hypothetical protein CDL15_Pgr014079 [Punica granatum]PKI31999.1 hypothetical protein CRG98_047608 [Punica granatum]
MGNGSSESRSNSREDGDNEYMEGSSGETGRRYFGFVKEGGISFDEMDAISEISQRTSLQNHDVSERGEDQTEESYELWRQEPKIGAVKLEEHFLRASCVLEELIEEELDRYRAKYTQPIDLTRLEDVAKFLMPDSAPPFQLASVGWLGDWRPTAMLALLMGLACSSASFSDPAGIERTVSELTREARIEEAIIDGELTEIQATCILNLPFAFIGTGNGLHGAASSCVQAELQKIKRVITKAQQLRFKTLETVVRKVPNPSDAAEFLMAFERIEGALHQYAAHHELKRGGVTFSVKRLGILDSA